jgi:hypothetical protein
MMWERFLTFVGHRRTRRISLAVALAVYALESVVPAILMRTDPVTPWRLDMPWLYQPESARSMIEQLGATGRSVVAASHVILDVPLPVAYAVCLSSYSIRLWGRRADGSRLGELGVMASVAAAAADLTENAGIFGMLLLYPRDLAWLPTVTWVASWFKWANLLVAGAIVARGGIRRLRVHF